MYRKQVRRRRALLALLVIGSFVLLTITYSRGSNGLQRGVATVFTPVEEVADRALKPARDLVNWFDETFAARGENEELRTELAELRERVVGADAALAENAQLRKLVGLNESGAIPSGYDRVAGHVIVRSPTFWYTDVTIDVGSGNGVEVDDPVVNGDGLVGKVTAVTPSSAKVTLISDSSSAVTAKVVPAGLEGIVKPVIGDPGDLVLEFIEAAKLVNVGQEVVTSGWRSDSIESRFPPNIPIGEVRSATPAEQEAQQRVHVEPYADLRNLDLVQVLTGGSR